MHHPFALLEEWIMRNRLLSHRGVRRRSAALALATGLVVSGSALGQLSQVTENFDTNPASRGWSGVANRTSPQNYGWSGDDGAAPGTFTGGAAGELGGAFTRANPASPIFYDDPPFNTIPQPAHPDNFYGVELGGLMYLPNNPFYVSGTVHLEQRDGGSGFLIGYSTGVSSYTDGVDKGDAKDFIGLFFDDGDNVGGLVYDSTGGRTLDMGAPNLVQGTTQTFRMIFDPSGSGSLVIVIDNAGYIMGLSGAAGDVGLLDHFGIMPVSANGSTARAWFDDLSYGVPGGSGPTFNVWKSTNAGSFNDDANWVGSAPNGIDGIANFLGAINVPRTVIMDSATTLGTLRMGNNATYSIGGAGSLTMQTSSGSALIEVILGTQKINVPLNIATNTDLSVLAGSTLKISDPVTVTAGKRLAQSVGGSVRYESTISVGAGGTIAFNSSSHALSLTLGSGARAELSAANPSAYLLQVHSLTAPSDARVDLGDNALAINYTGSSPLASVRSQVAAAYAANWNANGITSSSAASSIGSDHPLGIGVAEASALGSSTTYMGEQIDSTTVLARATYYGDADLNGTVDSQDFARLAAGYGVTTGGVWTSGDFDYNGKVNSQDFNLLAGNFGQAMAGALPGASLGAVVPEPSALTLLAWLGAGAIRRRRA
jgi:hypothetical protein